MRQQHHDAPRGTRTNRGLRALAEAVGPLAEPILRRRGLAMATVVRAWPEIVGEARARHLAVDRLVFDRDRSTHGTLVLRLGQSALATEVLHAAPVLIERINAALGFAAVGRLKLVHAAADGGAPTPPPPPARPLTADDEQALAAQLAPIADPELRQVLEALGRAARARHPGAPAAAGPGSGAAEGG